jgi:hypothetical protein
MRKLFNDGLGIIDSTSAINPGSTQKLPGNKTVTVNNVDQPSLGTPALPGRPVPSAPKPTVTPTVAPQVFSADSGYAPYETIFHELNIEAYPIYNFWTEDEETNDSEDRGDRALDDIPRYVRLYWEPAPRLRDTSVTSVPAAGKRDQRPVQFSTEIDRKNAIIQKGIAFDPEHLKNFSLIKNSVGNFYVSPGVLHAVAELPLQNTDIQDDIHHDEAAHYIDEESFLTHPDTVGVSIHELKANVHSMTNGMVNSARIAAASMSADIQAERAVLFDGQFSVSRPIDEGIMRVQSLASDGPNISFAARTANSNEPVPVDNVLNMISKFQEAVPARQVDRDVQARVRFVNPSIAGIISEEKVNHIAAPEHAESTAAVAQFLPNLEVISKSGLTQAPRQVSVPSFPSPPGLPPLEYVGYIIEKYRRNQSGVFELVQTIDLDNREYNEYVDTRVVYGGVYRYRIRAIIRWTRHKDVGVEGKVPYDVLALSTQARTLSAYQSSYFAGEWSKKWTYGTIVDTVPPAPPDELTVRPDSAKGKITISFRMPYNPQRDIFILRLFRKMVGPDGQDISGWQQLGPDYGPRNVYYEDLDVLPFQKNGGVRYVYAAQCLSRHWEYSTLSEQMAGRLNDDFRTFGEFPVEQLSQAGVRLENHGCFSVIPHRKFKGEIVVADEFTLSGRNTIGNRAMIPGFYIVRVESLETGERADFRVDITYDNRPTVVAKIPFNVYIPMTTRPVSKKTGSVASMAVQAPASGEKELGSNGAVASRSNFLPGNVR